MEEEFNIEKYRAERPMDYIMAMELINQASNKDEVFKKLYKVTRLHIPDLLYKYFSLTDDITLNESKLDTLHRKQIFMTDIKTLNDPFDSKAYFYRNEELKKFDKLAKFDGKLIDDFTSFTKITALTANGVNSMPMWAHYSNNHKGYCVSYDMKDKDNVQLTGCTLPVQYTNMRIDVTNIMENQVKKTLYEIEKQSAEGKKAIQLIDLTLAYMCSFLCNIKHETWSYEKEFRCSVGSKIEGMPFSPAKPKEIYIGMNCLPTYTDKLIKIAENLQIPIYKMNFDEHNTVFNLTSKKIN